MENTSKGHFSKNILVDANYETRKKENIPRKSTTKNSR